MSKKQARSGRGRPRAFDEDQALEAATRVFADKGFDATTMFDLEKAMGIKKFSIYATFGNKEELFRKALDRFTQASNAHLEAILAVGKAQDAIEKLLRGGVVMFCSAEGPGVCFVTQAPLTSEESSEETRRFVAEKRSRIEKAMQRR